MKTKKFQLKNALLIIIVMLWSSAVFSQAWNNPVKTRKTITVLNIDSKGLSFEPEQLGNILRVELAKLDTFEVFDRYDVSYLVEKNQLKVAGCYGKICLVEIGNTIKSDKMVGGSVELYGETIVITLWLVNVSTASVEKTIVKEFLNYPNDIQSMLNFTLRSLFDLKNEEFLESQLSKKANTENAIKEPAEPILRLNGPRMGFVCFSGKTAEILRKSRAKGGYGAEPVMSQFGYQFELRYLNDGKFQALFEFVPLISGLEQEFLIPSITILNGLRNNRNGVEFAFGPTFSLTKKAKGYYDPEDGTWHLASELNHDDLGKYDIITQEDNRGHSALNTGFVFALGFSIKSGTLNIPVNGFVNLSKGGAKVGASFGFNSRKKRR